jgi:hypothetical protein
MANLALAKLLASEECELAKAVRQMVDFILYSNYKDITLEIGRFDSFHAWKEFILERSLYGAAIKVEFAGSDAELNSTLAAIWDENC